MTGVRAWFVPPKAQAPRAEAPKAAPVYPDAEAQAVAARFARAYLGWNEDRAEERAALLAAVLPADSDTALGWDGKGRQDVLTVQPGAVTPGADHQARVRVEALIRAAAKATAKGKKKTPAAVSPARWVALDVPVVHTAGRVIVTGPPGLVGIPATGTRAPEIPTARTDPDLTPQTKAPVETFFAAYATGDTDAVTAPGASVPPLPAGVTYEALVDWAVDAGTGEDRTGTARVSWAFEGGATAEQVYRVQLTQVSSPDARRWQVSAVHGGVL
ncbi:conjugal transfer protein [Streptomyces niveus]|uniref:conjugal transfer protein n=1 Tax=Streptomyces niveus TaxID=193462 RepID=UPI0036B674D4